MAVRTIRISHPAFFGVKNAETVRFYTEVLGMDLVLRQPNLDDPGMEHLFFHVGNDNFIAYFVPKNEADGAAYAPTKVGYGSMNHLAMDVDEGSFAEAIERLEQEGIRFSGPIDRGYERSIYFRDPNGVQLELLTWITPLPPDLPQADVIKAAQEIRIARGAEFIEDEDVRSALEQIGREP